MSAQARPSQARRGAVSSPPRLPPCAILALAVLLGAPAPAPAAQRPGAPPVARPTATQDDRDVSQFNLSENRLALKGYDPVSCFPEGGGKPAKGSKRFEAAHKGVRYRFARARNLEAFKQNPSRYEPAYGGWCACSMAKGEKVEIDPTSFLVTDGKLYVFHKGFLSDKRARWLKDPENLRRLADGKWKALLKKPRKAAGR